MNVVFEKKRFLIENKLVAICQKMWYSKHIVEEDIMKKSLLTLSVLLVSVFTLSGCGNTKTLKCTKSEDGALETIKITFEKDKATKIDNTLEQTFETDEEVQSSKQVSDALLGSTMNSYEGVSYESKIDGKKLSINMVIEVDKLNDESAEALGYNDETTTYDETKKHYTDEGYTCE